jgi:hypothetical protein
LTSCAPSTNEELKKFNGEISWTSAIIIDGRMSNTRKWPSETDISSYTMIKFSNFLHGLTKYNVSFNIDDDMQLLDMYCAGQINLSGNITNLHNLEIRLENEDSFYMDIYEYQHLNINCIARFTKAQQNLHDEVLTSYCIQRDGQEAPEGSIQVRNILVKAKDTFQDFKLNFSGCYGILFVWYFM